MIKYDLQFFGGRGSSGGKASGKAGGKGKATMKQKLASAKVSSSGYLPTSIKAKNEKEAVDLFNKANANPKGNGYKIVGSGYTGYEIAPTSKGKAFPKKAVPRTKAGLKKNKDGTYRFV